ncbi:MAG: DUF1848 domain-containing protein [Tissierellaceae bacterium]|nr:DUF1848 domain-containing protein [Tissierellaceae bacterium]
MILSVSRRTDIPAFYTEWFFNRLNEGFVLVRNPMNYHQVSKIELSPSLIDCIVFWTKDPTKIIRRLNELRSYNYYFQVTITPYNKDIETNVQDKDQIINSFIELSQLIGRERVVWRYDPIMLTNKLTVNYHKENYERIASKLAGYTDLCIISFIDLYRKTERNMKHINPESIPNYTMVQLGESLSKIASKYNLALKTCSEEIDLSSVAINHAKCIDDKLISKIVGQDLDINKDKSQRDICGCISSIDIGAYNTCKNGCLYCYANFSDKTVRNNVMNHDVNSPFLVGNIELGDVIYERKMVSYKREYVQSTFFD